MHFDISTRVSIICGNTSDGVSVETTAKPRTEQTFRYVRFARNTTCPRHVSRHWKVSTAYTPSFYTFADIMSHRQYLYVILVLWRVAVDKHVTSISKSLRNYVFAKQCLTVASTSTDFRLSTSKSLLPNN